MAEIWRPQEIKVYQSWIESIVDEASDELSDWESSFLSDIQMRLDKGYNLTENQAKKLESIYTDKTS